MKPFLSLLAVDATGVGRPVVDILAAATLPAELVPITITGGTRLMRDGDGYGLPNGSWWPPCARPWMPAACAGQPSYPRLAPWSER